MEFGALIAMLQLIYLSIGFWYLTYLFKWKAEEWFGPFIKERFQLLILFVSKGIECSILFSEKSMFDCKIIGGLNKLLHDVL